MSEPTDPRDVIHAWTTGLPFGDAAWADLTIAALQLQDMRAQFGPAPRPAFRCAPLVFTVLCTPQSLTVRGGGFMPSGADHLWLGGEPLILHRAPLRAHDSINTAGRPYEPVVRAMLALAIRFGSGFGLTKTSASRESWQETDGLVTPLFRTCAAAVEWVAPLAFERRALANEPVMQP